MRFDSLIKAYEHLRIERPPELWEVEADEHQLLPLLGEVITTALRQGAALTELTLNFGNVVIESEPVDHSDSYREAPLGQYVAVTLSGSANFGPDDTWPRGAPVERGLLPHLEERLRATGVRFAYVRRLPRSSSLTVFLARLT